ncbi:MAG: DUF1015 domain-containing protein [Actinobacteria bacterium]|nr:DUF1015 domain-containing protein [Actinomycetota bacterium]
MSGGLSLAPFRARRFAADGQRLSRLLCPPYDVIDEQERAALLARDPDNAVSVILPRASREDGDAYAQAAQRLEDWVVRDVLTLDSQPALYVYEMNDAGTITRGLIGAVELRDPADGVILPHENTMAGPVADRLALMAATDANLEPIYLVYEGGGAASAVVAGVDRGSEGSGRQPAELVVSVTTPDGVAHRLWAITDAELHASVEADLSGRSAVIADGHHRYATYRALQAERRATDGPGPWDRGLTLIVDSRSYGPQVQAIHRVLPGVPLTAAVAALEGRARVREATDLAGARDAIGAASSFAAVLTDGSAAFVVDDLADEVTAGLVTAEEPAAMGQLDVTILHRSLVTRVWDRPDDEDAVRYAHSVHEALDLARATGGFAVLLRPTPVSAVTAVAMAGGRMPRKSTLFTPKPASGLVFRRFADEFA